MDRFARLIRWFVVAAVGALALPAYATWLPKYGTPLKTTNYPGGGAPMELDAACATGRPAYSTGFSVSLLADNRPANATDGTQATVSYRCSWSYVPPASGTGATNMSVEYIWCTPPKVINASLNGCSIPPDPPGEEFCSTKSGQSAGAFNFNGGSGSSPVKSPSRSVCVHMPEAPESGTHCLASATQPDFCAKYPEGWQCTYEKSTYTGDTCEPCPSCDGTNGPVGPGSTGDPGDSNTSQPPTPCPAGQLPGQINGTTVCKPSGADDTMNDGDSTTETETECEGDECTTTETQTDSDTTCEGGDCTTTTTTTITTTVTNTTTNTSTTNITNITNTTEGGIEDFCEARPTSAICREVAEGEEQQEQSQWGGACGSFQCSGDAVQCAMAKEQHQRACQLFDESGPSADYQAMVDLHSPRPQGHPGLTPTTFDFGSWLPSSGTAACIPDQVFSVAGVSVSIPWSQICDALRIMGNLAWAFALVHAAFLVIRRL